MPNIFDYNPANITPYPYWRWNKVLPAVYDDSLSQYEILSKLLYTVNDIITSTNTMGEQVEQLTQLVQQLIDGQFPSGIVDYVESIVEATIDDDIAAINQVISDISDEIESLENSLKWAKRPYKVAVFADSTFRTNTDPSTSESITSIVTFMQQLSEIEVADYSVSGSSSDSLYSIVSDLTYTEIEDADVVIVGYGTNDWQSSRPLIRITDTQTTTFDYYYRESLKLLKAKAPNANIICVSPAYAHSTSANSVGILNVNQTGNEIYSYGDVIEKVANDENCQCVRLDKLMGVGEENYRYKLVQSGSSGIWVHYSASTNKKIATILCGAFFGANSTAPQVKAIDITPPSFRENALAVTYYSIGKRQGFSIPSAGMSFNIDNLIQNEKYYLSFIGGVVDVFVNNNQIAQIRNQSISVIPFTVSSNGTATIRFEQNATAPNYAFISNVRVTVGRPNVFDATYDDASIKYKTFTTSVADYRGRSINGNRLLYMHADSITVTNATTSVDTLPNNEFRGGWYVGLGIGNVGSTPTQIQARVNNDGTIYINQPSSGTITNARIYLIGLEP